MSNPPSQLLEVEVASVLAKPDASAQEYIRCLTNPQLAGFQNRESRLKLLKRSLQQAVELEFGTIPIYLAALWSIKDNLHPVAKSIRNIVHEEMLHMALASNMLASIGGVPKIYDPSPRGLRYPTKLPGGVHPKLVLKLSGLTDDLLEDFLEIELPQDEITIDTFRSKYHDGDHSQHANTIGALYDAINTEFHNLKPAMTPDHQVTGPLSWFVVDDLEKIESAIHWIKEQGEGGVNVQPKQDATEHLSHFYRFWEVRRRQKIEWDPAGGKFAFKSPFPFPEVWPMAVVPDGGYKEENVTPEVWRLVSGFDILYSKLIHLLESAWGSGGQAALWQAIDMMFSLEKMALPLMQIPIPGGQGNYGPCFRLVKY
jgi:rubrerythrin